MLIITTFDQFKAVVASFKKPTVVYHVNSTVEINVGILEAGGPLVSIQPAPSEADFLTAVPSAIVVTSVSG